MFHDTVGFLLDHGELICDGLYSHVDINKKGLRLIYCKIYLLVGEGQKYG